jgi:hypothetical protein
MLSSARLNTRSMFSTTGRLNHPLELSFRDFLNAVIVSARRHTRYLKTRFSTLKT